MRFLIYCPCNVRAIGATAIAAETFASGVMHFLLWSNLVYEREQVIPGLTPECLACGAMPIVVGRDIEADRIAGVTPEMIRRDMAEPIELNPTPRRGSRDVCSAA